MPKPKRTTAETAEKRARKPYGIHRWNRVPPETRAGLIFKWLVDSGMPRVKAERLRGEIRQKYVQEYAERKRALEEEQSYKKLGRSVEWLNMTEKERLQRMREALEELKDIHPEDIERIMKNLERGNMQDKRKGKK